MLAILANRGLAIAAEKVHVGYSAISAVTVPLWAAQEKGLFKKYGLDTELIYLAGGSRVVLAARGRSPIFTKRTESMRTGDLGAQIVSDRALGADERSLGRAVAPTE